MHKVNVIFVCPYVTWWRAGNSNVKLPLCLDGRLRNGRRHCLSDEAALTCKSHSHIVCECSIPWSSNISHQLKWTFPEPKCCRWLVWHNLILSGMEFQRLGRVGNANLYRVHRIFHSPDLTTHLASRYYWMTLSAAVYVRRVCVPNRFQISIQHFG